MTALRDKTVSFIPPQLITSEYPSKFRFKELNERVRLDGYWKVLTIF